MFNFSLLNICESKEALRALRALRTLRTRKNSNKFGFSLGLQYVGFAEITRHLGKTQTSLVFRSVCSNFVRRNNVSMIMDKLVTVIVPVYNRAEVVGRTLESVLAQTYRPLQLVLVDNDSNDDSLAVLADFASAHESDEELSIVVVTESHHTAGAARNRGLREARGEWVLFFDSDDLMKPRLVESYMALVERLDGQVDLIAARGRLVMPDGTGRELPFYRSDVIARHLLHGVLATQRYAVRREFVNSIDGWNINIPGWNDWEMGVRLLMARPRMGYLTARPMVQINHSGEQSITGNEFHSRAGRWENVIDIVETEIRCAPLKNRERYLRLLDYRRLVLAAHYHREGHPQLAKPLCREAYASLSRSYGNSFKWRHFVAPVTRWLFARIAAGKRGSAQIARVLYR